MPLGSSYAGILWFWDKSRALEHGLLCGLGMKSPCRIDMLLWHGTGLVLNSDIQWQQKSRAGKAGLNSFPQGSE